MVLLVQNIYLKSFKPCYKWNTFNTVKEYFDNDSDAKRFKPYYKWNTFNTKITFLQIIMGILF